MAHTYSDRDASIIPEFTFSFVEDYIKTNKFSSGEKSINKGYKYYSESYIHNVKVQKTDTGCTVMGRCHRSQRKNEEPYKVEVNFGVEISGPEVKNARCQCAFGLNASCGHITGLLYQLANYKMLGMKSLPEDIAKTSLPQTFHLPRGLKVGGISVEDVEVKGYSRTQEPGTSCEEPKSVKSTLYNAIRGEPVDWLKHRDALAKTDPNLLIFPAIMQQTTSVSCKFGKIPFGSVLSYQQKLNDDYIINLFDGVGFPSFPLKDSLNDVNNNGNRILNSSQDSNLSGLYLTTGEINKFEAKTRLQSRSRLWYKIRSHRVTASQIGRIYKRRKDSENLVKQLKSTRKVFTAAMRRGIACEPMAAQKYAQILNNNINLYPCGVVVNFVAPWYAASPDRKVYNPSRNPQFGLLEIKCPHVSSVLEAKCLKKDATGELSLKRNHDYYYQMLTQMACTGVEWCDFFVWCENDYHLETIYFNEDIWKLVRNKVDEFFFNFFIE